MWAGVAATRELASTWPELPRAWTWKNAAALCSLILVSNPRLPPVPRVLRVAEVLPPRTLHDETSVAPFQDAYRLIEPSLFGLTDSAGDVDGWAFHANR